MRKSVIISIVYPPTTPAFSHPSFPEGGEAIRRKPFGKKGEKFLPEASVVGRDIHSYNFNFPIGVGDAFYQNGLFVSIGAEFCHCFSQFSKSGSCSSGWNQRQSPSM